MMTKLLATIVAALFSVGSAQAATFTGSHATQYTKWAQTSKLPQVPLNIQANMNQRDCGGAAGCRSAGKPWAIFAADRDSFFFELGGEYDYAYLKGWQREYLTRLMQPDHKAPWFTTSEVVTYTEDGLEADFNSGYADCAEGWTQTHGLSAGLAPAVIITPAFCRFIRNHPQG